MTYLLFEVFNTPDVDISKELLLDPGLDLFPDPVPTFGVYEDILGVNIVPRFKSQNFGAPDFLLRDFPGSGFLKRREQNINKFYLMKYQKSRS